MRTILMGRKHGAKEWQIILGPDARTNDQIIKRDELSTQHPVHADWAEVEMWVESHHKSRLKFTSPKDAEKRKKADEEADKAFEAEQAKRAEQIAKLGQDSAAAKAKAHADEVAAKNKLVAGFQAAATPKTDAK